MGRILWFVPFLCAFVHSILQTEVVLIENAILVLIPENIRGSGPCDFSSPCTRGDWIGAVVRLSFHDAAGYGGTNGCIDPNEQDHTGLSGIMGELETLYEIYSHKLSRADFWVLAANVAVKEAGGPDVGFKWGRTDLADCAGLDAGLLPAANLGYEEVTRVFITRLDFTPREVVALMGGHTLGRMETANSGFNGPWVRNADEFDNAFFSGYEGVRWRTDNNGGWTGGNNLVMLNTDVSLLFKVRNCQAFGGTGGGRNDCTVADENTETGGFVREYAVNNALFITDFALAFQKLQEVTADTLCTPETVFGDSSCSYVPPSVGSTVVTATLVDTIKSSVVALLPGTVQGACSNCNRGDFVGALIRLSFHDAAGNGGADGCIDGCTISGCNGQTDHTGLSTIMGELDPTYQLFKGKISRADFWVLAANAVFEAIGGPLVPFRYGRTDDETCQGGQDNGLLPDGEGDWAHVKDVFVTRMGFTIKEVVALMGAHTLGRMELSNSGFSGPWTRDQDSLGVDYYSSIPGIRWNKGTSADGKEQWTAGGSVTMLNTDMAMYIAIAGCTSFGDNSVRGDCPVNTEASSFVDEYAASQSTWFQDFASAFQKLQELGPGGTPNADLQNVGGIPNCIGGSQGIWLDTAPGTTQTKTCPSGTSGEWSRFCDSTGTWSTVVNGCITDPTCSDGIQNQGEEGIDCGGTGTGCNACSVLFCSTIQCTAKGTCNEASQICVCVDGYTGDRCEIPPVDPCSTILCSSHSLGCVSGICQCADSYTGTTCDTPPAPTCSDGFLNQDELAVDCGGTCSPCVGYSWHVGDWSTCTKTCGTGIQSRDVKCLDTNGVSVNVDLCDQNELHAVSPTQSCNTMVCAEYSWVPAEWDAMCSVACGPGIQNRRVDCVSSLGGVVEEQLCSSTNKPSVSQVCNVATCTPGLAYNWIGSWSNCSQTCGTGSQTWVSVCNNISSSIRVADSFCASGTQISDSRSCNTEACQVYTYTICPLDECTALCGGSSNMLGQQHRDIYCMNLDGQIADPTLCAGQIPKTSISGCNSDPCTGSNWMADGPWSDCVAGTRSRTYHCHEASGANAALDVCSSAPLPVSASNWQQANFKTAPRASKSCSVNMCDTTFASAFSSTTKLQSTLIIPTIISFIGLVFFL